MDFAQASRGTAKLTFAQEEQQNFGGAEGMSMPDAVGAERIAAPNAGAVEEMLKSDDVDSIFGDDIFGEEIGARDDSNVNTAGTLQGGAPQNVQETEEPFDFMKKTAGEQQKRLLQPGRRERFGNAFGEINDAMGLNDLGLQTGAETKAEKRAKATAGLSKMAIRRLARRGGVKRISATVYNDAREILGMFMEKMLTDTVTYVVHGKRTTVKPVDIVNALRRNGRNIYGYGA